MLTHGFQILLVSLGLNEETSHKLVLDSGNRNSDTPSGKRNWRSLKSFKLSFIFYIKFLKWSSHRKYPNWFFLFFFPTENISQKKNPEPFLSIPKIYIHTSLSLMTCGTRGKLFLVSTWHHGLNLLVNIKPGCSHILVSLWAFTENDSSGSYTGLLPFQSNPQQDSYWEGKSDQCTCLIFVLEYE